MPKKFYAHSFPGRPPGEWQPWNDFKFQFTKEEGESIARPAYEERRVVLVNATPHLQPKRQTESSRTLQKSVSMDFIKWGYLLDNLNDKRGEDMNP